LLEIHNKSILICPCIRHLLSMQIHNTADRTGTVNAFLLSRGRKFPCVQKVRHRQGYFAV
jgi:hypothetical protein